VFRRRRKSAPYAGPGGQLFAAAGVHATAASSPAELGREVALAVANATGPAPAQVLAVTEELLATDEAYELVLSTLEDLQNLLSFGLPGMRSEQQIVAALGPRGRTAWQTLANFWSDVAAWRRAQELKTPYSRDELVAVDDPDLRKLVLTIYRVDASGELVGLPDVVAYELQGLGSLPNYSHIAALGELAGEG
jgi:hypothetical protein